MQDFNQDELDVYRREAEECIKRGDVVNAKAIYQNIFRISYPIVEEEVRQNPEIVSAIMVEALQPGPAGEAAHVLLKHLQKKGLAPE